MQQKKARCTHQKSILSQYLILSILLLPCFLSACTNPLLSSSTPPQPGKVLYTLSWGFHALSLEFTVEAMNSSNGQKIWQTSLTSSVTSTEGQGTSIISAGTTIFVTISPTSSPGSSQKGQIMGQVFALEAQSGHILWKTTLDGTEIEQPTVANGNLYMDVDKKIEALDGTNGNRLWSTSADAGYIIGNLAVAGNTVYVEQEKYFLPTPQGSAILRALRLSDGTELWRRDVASTISGYLLAPVHVSIQADEQAVYVLEEGQIWEAGDPISILFALNPQNGSLLWGEQTQQPDEDGGPFNLVLFNHVLYSAGSIGETESSTLSAFQSQNGKQLWSWQTPFIINPFAPPNHIYGLSPNTGEGLCALRANDGSKVWCANYNLAGPTLFSQGKIYLYAYKVNDQGRDQSLQVFVLNERDGNLVAHYAPNTVLLSMALS